MPPAGLKVSTTSFTIPDPESWNRVVLMLQPGLTGSPPLGSVILERRKHPKTKSHLVQSVLPKPVQSYSPIIWIHPMNSIILIMKKRVSAPLWLHNIPTSGRHVAKGAVTAKRLVRRGNTEVGPTVITGPRTAKRSIICIEEAKKLDKTSSLLLVCTDAVATSGLC